MLGGTLAAWELINLGKSGQGGVGWEDLLHQRLSEAKDDLLDILTPENEVLLKFFMNSNYSVINRYAQQMVIFP